MQDDTFFQKYKYIRPLGRGGCGEVFLAENRKLGNCWAVKVIQKEGNSSVSGYIEPQILKRLNHPALPRICDVYENETEIYIIEDYIEGVCLKQELDLKENFEEQQVIDWGIQLFSVLDYLHNQTPDPIIYGDMKPHNIILTKEGFIKLIDFGISKTESKRDKPDNLNETALLSETAFIGTKGYAAPEQYSGEGISKSTDIYSLGITLIQLASGINPLKSAQLYRDKKYRDFMSSDLAGILEKCTELNPYQRYRSASQVMKELKTLGINKTIHHTSGINQKNSHLTKIFAFAGAGGTGVSTLCAAFSEYAAKRESKVCIVDLSRTRALKRSLLLNGQSSSNPVKVTNNLYYQNLCGDCNSISLSNKNPYDNTNPLIHNTDPLVLYKQFSQLQDQFSLIFVDTDLPVLKLIEQYVNHIYLVCDMNPLNISELGDRLAAEKLNFDGISKISFIVNKFYKGELSSSIILHNMLFNNFDEDYLRNLISLSKIYEVPYDKRVYLGWAYSGFGEPLRFKRELAADGFGAAISQIAAGILPFKGAKPLIPFKKFFMHQRG